MTTPYYSPEDYGLKLVAALDLKQPDYDFEILAVWQRESGGALLFATDSGCSCPSPFEGVTVANMSEWSDTAVRDIIREAQTERTYREGPRQGDVDGFWRLIREAQKSTVRAVPDADSPPNKWEDDNIQFPRLLAEIYAVGLKAGQYAELCDSMGLVREDIDSLFERAECAWLRIKGDHDFCPYHE